MLGAARAANELLASAAVAEKWNKPSSLEGFTVGGLAAHVTTVLASCHRCIDDPESSDSPLPPEAYYTTFALTEPGSDANLAIVAHGEERARHGPAATAARFAEQLRALEERLADVSEDRVVQIFGMVSMRLDDFFLTRALEFAVHCDDLACSVGMPTPRFEEDTIAAVISHLVATARYRHGDVAVLRALARRERDEVEALRVL